MLEVVGVDEAAMVVSPFQLSFVFGLFLRRNGLVMDDRVFHRGFLWGLPEDQIRVASEPLHFRIALFIFEGKLGTGEHLLAKNNHVDLRAQDLLFLRPVHDNLSKLVRYGLVSAPLEDLKVLLKRADLVESLLEVHENLHVVAEDVLLVRQVPRSRHHDPFAVFFRLEVPFHTVSAKVGQQEFIDDVFL